MAAVIDNTVRMLASDFSLPSLLFAIDRHKTVINTQIAALVAYSHKESLPAIINDCCTKDRQTKKSIKHAYSSFIFFPLLF